MSARVCKLVKLSCMLIQPCVYDTRRGGELGFLRVDLSP